MKTHQNNTLRCLWAIGCCLLLAGPSFAARPQPKPPPEPPPPESAAYQYIELGSPGARGAEVLKVNASGVVLGRYGTDLFNADGMEINGLFVVVPVLISAGLPVWFVNDGSGKNQLMTVLGLPEVLEQPADSNIQADINDHGQVVLNVGKELFVLQPQFNHTTQSWSYVPEGFNGINPWMTKVTLNGGGEYEFLDTPSINNSGQIVGITTYNTGPRPFIAVPSTNP